MGETIDALVVDEDPEVLELTGTFLERKSDRISVVTEQSAVRAADRAVEEGFDCIVSDYRMPELNGIELYETVRARDDIPFFLFTGVSDTEIGEKAREAGVSGVVRKGAGTDHYDDLVEQIEAAVE